MEQETILRKIGAALEALSIPYLITGGLTVTVWGRPRFTADIDLVLEVAAEQVDPLVRSLRALGPDLVVDPQAVADAVHDRNEFTVLDMASGLKLDYWVKPSRHERNLGSNPTPLKLCGVRHRPTSGAKSF